MINHDVKRCQLSLESDPALVQIYGDTLGYNRSRHKKC
jgi:hypothetical protein